MGIQGHGRQTGSLGNTHGSGAVRLEDQRQHLLTLIVHILANPACKDLALRRGDERRDDLFGVGVEEVADQLGLPLHKGQADLAHRLGHVLVGGVVAQPAAAVLGEEQGLGVGDGLHRAVDLHVHLHLQGDAAGEQRVGIANIIGDFFVEEFKAIVVLRPQVVVAQLGDALVGLAGGLIILGQGSPVSELLDHPLAVALGSTQSSGLFFYADGLADSALGKGLGGLVIGYLHGVAHGIVNLNGRLGHQTVDLLEAFPDTGGSQRQIGVGLGGSNLNGVVVTHLNSVEQGPVAFHLFDAVGALPLEEQLHAAKLPVRDLGTEKSGVSRFLLVVVLQGEGGDFLTAVANHVFFVIGQAGGGFQIRQVCGVHLGVHIVDKLLLALKGGVLGTGGNIQVFPVGVGKELLVHLLGLDIRLGSLVVDEPAVKPLHTEEHSHKENQDKQEIQGVEDQTAQTGALLHGRGLRLRSGSAGRLGRRDVALGIPGLGSIGTLHGFHGCFLPLRGRFLGGPGLQAFGLRISLGQQLLGAYRGLPGLLVKFSFIHDFLPPYCAGRTSQ